MLFGLLKKLLVMVFVNAVHFFLASKSDKETPDVITIEINRIYDF